LNSEDLSIIKKSQEKYRVNEDILKRREVRRVLVIDDEGTSLGEMNPMEAIHLAKDQGLSLVEISPNAQPPVCRVMDYGKFSYDQKKKQAVAKKKQKQVELKEVKFRPTTDEGDFQVKLRSILSFLEDGNKVKITIRFRGREVMHSQLGDTLLQRIAHAVSEKGIVEQQYRLEGRQMGMMIGPKKAG
jgi:translation initiation factor IF-3